MEVLDIPEGNKANALNSADRQARGGIRIYLDADVTCDPGMVGALVDTLDRPEPAYASGQLRVAPAQNWTSRCYAAIWVRLPFMTDGVPGAGLFAVNAAGRKRWDQFPAIISDDSYVRLSFAPHERHGGAPGYDWPVPEGWSNLVRVRRRQDAGMEEIRRYYPEKLANEGKTPLTLGRLLKIALTAPIGFAVYIAISLAVRSKPMDFAWNRGR